MINATHLTFDIDCETCSRRIYRIACAYEDGNNANSLIGKQLV